MQKGEKLMAEIMKVFREEVPAMRFIGKKYHDYSAGASVCKRLV